MDLGDLVWGLRRGRRGSPAWVPASESRMGRELLKVVNQDDRVKNLQSAVRSFLNTFIELECLLTVV